jgi:multidrug transporter EmrE-like cation transporter
MSLPQIVALSSVEIIGDFGLNAYANNGGILNLGVGIMGYIGVVSLLVVALQGSSILMVNGAWDAISTLLESAAAYIILGERFDNYLQYFGLCLIVIGLYFLKVPLTKNHPFKIPPL